MVEMMKQQMLMGMQSQNMSADEEDMDAEDEGDDEEDADVEGEDEDDEDMSSPADAMAEVASAEFDLALSLLNQTETLQLGISLEDDGLRFGKAVFASKDSDLAAFMMAQSPKKSALLGVIPSDSAVLMSGSLNFTPEFRKGYLEFFEMMLSVDDKLEDDTLATLVEWAENAFEAFGGDFAAGMLSPTSDTLASEVLSLKDAELAKKLVGQYPEMLQSMMGMYEEMGIDFKMSLGETKEVEAGEVMQYAFNFNADMVPDPQGQEVFKALFGETLALPIGFTKEFAVVGFGKDAEGQVAQIMGTLNSGEAMAAEYTPSNFGLPEENNLFLYVSVPKVLAWASAKNLPDMPPFEAVDGPGLAMAGRFVESHFEGELYLPIEEIMAIKQIGEQAQGQGAPPAPPAAE